MIFRACLVLTILATLVFSPGCDEATPVAPTGASLTISANPTRIDTDGTSEITVIARREEGSPVNPGTEINFSTTLGTIGSVGITDERGIATTTLVGDERIGTATVTANSGAADEISVDVAVGALAGSITLVPTPSGVSANLGESGETIQLVATVRDDTGSPLRNFAVTFLTDTGSLASRGTAVFTTDQGVAEDTVTILPADLSVLVQPSFDVFAQAATEGGDLLEAAASILIQDVASFVVVSANPASVPSTGGNVGLTAQVFDAASNPVSGALVNFGSTAGSLASGGAVQVTGGDGAVSDSLALSDADVSGLSTITVTGETIGFGGATLTDTFAISVEGAPPCSPGVPNASFSSSITGMDVTFTDLSTNSPTSWSWNFGDGGTSSSQNPTHTYATSGVFSVSLTASNACGSDSATQSITIP